MLFKPRGERLFEERIIYRGPYATVPSHAIAILPLVCTATNILGGTLSSNLTASQGSSYWQTRELQALDFFERYFKDA